MGNFNFRLTNEIHKNSETLIPSKISHYTVSLIGATLSISGPTTIAEPTSGTDLFVLTVILDAEAGVTLGNSLDVTLNDGEGNAGLSCFNINFECKMILVTYFTRLACDYMCMLATI